MRAGVYKDELMIASVQRKEEEKYWLSRFSGGIKKSAFPYDFKKTGMNNRARESLKFDISGDTFARIENIINNSDVRLFIILVSGIKILLNKYTNNENITIGTTIYKQDSSVDFINTVLAITNRLNPDELFKDTVLKIGESIFEADKNRNFPIEKLLYELNINFSEGDDFPLFDILVLLENIHDKRFIEHINTNILFYFSRKDGHIEGELEYNPLRYDRETVKGIVEHFTNLLGEALRNVHIQIGKIKFVSKEEKRKLLEDFNNTEAEYPRSTIHELFEEQVDRTPGSIAPVVGNTHMTYRLLNTHADRLARRLREKGVEPNTIVAVLSEHSIEMIVGILAVLKAGGAYLPIDCGYPGERIGYMLDDSGVSIILTDSEDIKKVRDHNWESPGEQGIEGQPGMFVFIHGRDKRGGQLPEKSPSESGKNIGNINDPGDLAYIIYTSGTTGQPKGAMIEHKNVVRLLVNDHPLFDFNHRDVWTMFHSYCFDFSVWEMYGALLYGGKLIIIPRNVSKDPWEFLEILKDECVTILNQTPSAFYNLTDIEIGCGKRELRLKYVIFGGEVLNPYRLRAWKDRYLETKLINMYGITETTVHVTYKQITYKEIEQNISNIGRPIPTSTAYILDGNLNLLPMGLPGELYVGGEGVCRGYLGKVELTGDCFLNNPYKEGERLYRSGDLVKLAGNGEMGYLGRIDSQVKIRGFRIELGEIENQLLEIGDVKEAVVMDRMEETGEKYLCAYIVSHKEIETSVLKDSLLKKLPDYMIPAYFVQLEKIPLTANGKVDRSALPLPEKASKEGVIAPRNPIQEKLVEIWSEVLNVPGELIGIGANFFDLGGHSLRVTTLISKIHKCFNVRIPIIEIFEKQTIKELAEFIKEAQKDVFTTIKPGEKKEYYVLSSAQKRLYFLQELKPGSTTYNNPVPLILQENADVRKMEDTFCRLIRRHDSFRTLFKMIDNEPVQVIKNAADFRMTIHDLADKTEIRAVMEKFVEPFDLSRAPLFRAAVIKVGEDKVLLIDMHHIITDGTSYDIMKEEFRSLYSGKNLPPLKLQYKDYSEWQNNRHREELIKQQEEYWEKNFAGDLPHLDLPTDYQRPAGLTYEGGFILFEVGEGETKSLYELAKSLNVTLYIILLAAYNILFFKLSGQEDIIVGTINAGRIHPDIEKILGIFVNTIPVRNQLLHEKTFIRFIKEVKKSTCDAFENQEFQFDDLVEKLSIERRLDENPLFNVMFVLQNFMEKVEKRSGIKETDFNQTPYNFEYRTSKFDLTLVGIEYEECLSFYFEYNSRLFKRSTIELFGEYFQDIISLIAADPEKKLSEVLSTSRQNRHKKIDQFNVDLENE